MTVPVVIAAFVLMCALVALRRRHYVLAIALSVMGAYELLGPVLFSFAEAEDTLPFLTGLAGNASGEEYSEFIEALAFFFLLFIAAYLLAGRGRVAGNRPVSSLAASPDAPRVFPWVILAFGIVSVATGAGEARLEDYVGIGDTPESSRFFAYGGLLLVVCTGLLLRRVSAKDYSTAAFVAICMAPLLIELFIAGRRQWFAPSAMLVVLFLLYARVRFKALLVAGFTAMMAVLFALQYSLREAVQQGATGLENESLPYAVLAPQAGEFVGIGSISQSSWNMFVADDASLSGGLYMGIYALNTIPFLKLGDILFPQRAGELAALHRELAPWGGFSLISDAIIAFGWIGIPLLAIGLGLLCRIAHRYVQATLGTGMPVQAGSLYMLSLISTLLLKYRGGIGDALQSFVSFSVLYWFLAYLGYLAFDRRTGIMRTLRNEAPQSGGQGIGAGRPGRSG